MIGWVVFGAALLIAILAPLFAIAKWAGEP